MAHSVQYRAHNSPSLVLVPIQIGPILKPLPYFLKIQFNFMLPPTSRCSIDCFPSGSQAKRLYEFIFATRLAACCLLRVSVLNFLVYCNNNNNNNNNNNKVIPVTIVAAGPISESFRRYLRNRPGKRDVKTTETKAILGNADIVRKVLI